MNVSPAIARRPIRFLLVLLAAWSCGGDPIPPQVGGSVTVSVTTTGEDQDADGYTIRVGSAEATVAVSGAATIEGLEPGSYDVTLAGIAANCTLLGDATRSVVVAEGQGASVEFEVECIVDAAGLALAEASCSALAPTSFDGMPFDEVQLGSVPASFEPPIYARMAWSGGGEVSFGLVDEDAQGLPMMVPLHPSGSLDGGDVTVRISDETQSCPPFGFTILPLPSAPGELEELVDVAQALLDEQATLFGTTRDDLLSTPASQLEPALLPLAIAQAVIDEPASDASLRSLLDGAAPDFGANERDFVERMLARTGLRTDLESELADLRSAGPSPGSPMAGSPGPALALTPGLALDCVTTQNMDAQLLHDCMTLARDKAQGAASMATQDQAIFALDMAALAGGKIVAGPISSLIGFSQLYDEVVANNLPSWFTNLDVTLTPAAFLEDQAGPGNWSPAEVTAMSNGWSFEDVVTGLITDRITPDVRPVQRRLTRREKLLMKVSGTKLPADVKIVENLFQEVVERLLSALVGRGVSLGDDLLTIPPLTYGPVDVTDTEWTDSRIVTGTSVVLTSHEQYEPQEPGTSLLEVITAVGKFGGTSIATDHLPIEVGQIGVSISPSDVLMEPGQDTTFTVTVSNALHPDSIELMAGNPTQGSASLQLGNANVHTVTYSAPQAPTPGSTDLVAVHHIAAGGARGLSAAPRSATATIRFVGIDLLPVQGCVSPGQDVQLEWALTGFQTAPTLVWTASAGSVDANGVFTAPNQADTVTITVAVQGHQGVEDSITVPVGACTCSFTLQVGGNAPYVGQPGDRVSYFSAVGAVPGEPTAVGSVTFENAAGFSAVAGVEIPTIVVNGPGDYPLSTIAGGLGYGSDQDFFEEVDPPQGTLRIVEYEPHTALVGEVIGGLVQDAFDSQSPVVTFDAVFQIYPPAGSLGWTYSCVIPTPP